jgi:hypothetical protein
MYSKSIGTFVISAIVLTAGCSAGNSTLSQNQASVPLPSSAHAAAANPLAETASSGKYVYATEFSNSDVLVFKRGGSYKKPLYTITTGISQPKAVTVDGDGNLYVANAGNETVTVYEPGQTSPSTTYSSLIYDPAGVAVSPDKHLYVADACCGSPTQPSGIVDFAIGNTNPVGFIRLPSQTITLRGVTVDKKGHMFVPTIVGSSCATCGQVYEFDQKKGSFVSLGLTNLGSTGRMTVDAKGNLIVVDFYQSLVDVFPAGATKPSAQYTVPPYSALNDVAISKNNKQLFVTDARSGIYVMSYPGGTLQKSIAGSFVLSVAVTPNALL